MKGNELLAKKPAVQNIVNGKKISLRDIDRTRIPDNVKITDLTLSDPKNPTKVSVESNDISNALWDFIPSILGMLLLIFFLMFIMGRM